MRLFGLRTGAPVSSKRSTRGEERAEHGGGFETGEAHADARVLAEAEPDVARAVAGDVEHLGRVPPSLVAVRRREAHEDTGAGRQRDAGELGRPRW